MQKIKQVVEEDEDEVEDEEEGHVYVCMYYSHVVQSLTTTIDIPVLAKMVYAPLLLFLPLVVVVVVVVVV